MEFLFNPLSPSINIQILQTDLHTSPQRISWDNLIIGQGIFSLVIILFILITLSLDSVWILLGENWSWSPLGLKGLTIGFLKSIDFIFIFNFQDQANEPSPLKSDELEPNSMKRSHKMRLAELLRNKRQKAYEDFMFENQKEWSKGKKCMQ